MAEDEEMHEAEDKKSETKESPDLEEDQEDHDEEEEDGAGTAGEGGKKNNMSSNSNRSSYRQKYKHAWELDNELKGWLTACRSDAYAGFCKFCQTKLHAHKKGLLAHAKSSKHKKHLANPNYAPDVLAIMGPSDSFQMDAQNGGGGDYGDEIDSFGRGKKLKSHRMFNDSWLKDPTFQQWLRKVPNNNAKALCIACRCVITAGRCELLKHTRAAKHKKAMLEGPFEEVGEDDLQWLDCQHDQDHGLSPNKSITYHQEHFRHLDLPGLMLDDIIERLNKHVPLELAEKWDNVGIISKPTQPVKVYNLLLTIDLTERIVEEAIKKRVQFIISYHPPIFNPIKRLNPNQWKERAILMCIEHKITVYSPHTALDAIKGGINDWLISTFTTSEGNKVRPIIHSTDHKNTTCLEVLLSEPPDTVAQAFKDVNNVTMTECANMCGTSSTDVRVACDDKSLPRVIEQLTEHNVTQVCSRLTKLSEVPIPGIGMGRTVTFATPLPLYEVIERTKTHLDLQYIRLALSRKHTRDTKISSIAVCAGSGSGVLKGCEADVWITGEMSHHDVLDAVNSNITVVLCEHSNTERGFLRDWSQQLRNSVFEDQVMVTMSELDRDPLRVI